MIQEMLYFGLSKKKFNNFLSKIVSDELASFLDSFIDVAGGDNSQLNYCWEKAIGIAWKLNSEGIELNHVTYCKRFPDAISKLLAVDQVIHSIHLYGDKLISYYGERDILVAKKILDILAEQK